MSSESSDPLSRVARNVAGDRSTSKPAAYGRPPKGEWITPIPADAPPRPSKFDAAEAVYEYRTAAGELSWLVGRFADAKQGKTFLPLTLRRDDKDRLTWSFTAPPPKRSLFGLELLNRRPDAPVIVVEGEKAALAARRQLPQFVVVCWPNGTAGVKTADWSPLAGREVIFIPDHDGPGREAVEAGKSAVLRTGASHAGFVKLPVYLPPKWDLADPWPADFSLRQLLDLIEDARREHMADAAWPRGFEADERGLWWSPPDSGKGDDPPPRQWICAPLTIIGLVRDHENGNWGTAIEFADHDGVRKQLVILHADMAGEAIDVRKRLLNAGLSMRADKASRDRLTAALAGVRPTRRARHAFTTGWAAETAYVVPKGVLGRPVEPIIYSGPQRASYHAESGDYEAWRNDVAAPATGNAVLLFAISSAFAGALLKPLAGEGGGFHFRGASSCGKTTALKVAGSVWGGGGTMGFVQPWRATANALENIAHAHNDAVLCLDEIKTLGAEAAGDTAYALATGQMKARQNSNSDLRTRLSWLLIVLSSGEMSLQALIRSSKNRDLVQAGQELRMLDIQAELQRNGDAWSAWQDIHEAPSHADFSESLQASALQHYGHAGPLFIERFVADRGNMLEAAQRLRAAFLADMLEDGDTGQIRRAAERFAVVSVAGELATLLDVTPWAAGEATAATAFLFRRWAHSFGRKRAREELQAIRTAREFIERFEHARFRPLKADMTEEEALAEQVKADEDKPRAGEARSLDLAGFWSIREEGKCYHFNTEFFQHELFKGRDAAAAARALKAAGLLKTDKEPGRNTFKIRLPGGSLRPSYTVLAKILELEFTEDE